jgi:hypothetical protein
MGTSVTIEGQNLVVHLHGFDIVQAFRASVSVPLSHIKDVRVRPPEAKCDDFLVDSWRGIGTYVSNQYAIGTMQLHDGESFFSVHDPDRSIAIDLEDDRFTHIVIDIDGETPEAVRDRILRAIA